MLLLAEYANRNPKTLRRRHSRLRGNDGGQGVLSPFKPL